MLTHRAGHFLGCSSVPSHHARQTIAPTFPPGLGFALLGPLALHFLTDQFDCGPKHKGCCDDDNDLQGKCYKFDHLALRSAAHQARPATAWRHAGGNASPSACFAVCVGCPGVRFLEIPPASRRPFWRLLRSVSGRGPLARLVGCNSTIGPAQRLQLSLIYIFGMQNAMGVSQQKGGRQITFL